MMAINKRINLIAYLLVALILTGCVKQSVSDDFRSGFTEPSSVSKPLIADESGIFPSPHDFSIRQDNNPPPTENSELSEKGTSFTEEPINGKQITSKDTNDEVVESIVIDEGILGALGNNLREESIDDLMVIMSKDINGTLEIIILGSEDCKLVSFNSNDIEEIIIPKSNEGGNYFVEFKLTPNAIKKAEPNVSFFCEFPISVSINEKTLGFFCDDKNEIMYHYARTISHPTEGLHSIDFPLHESSIARESLKALFTK